MILSTGPPVSPADPDIVVANSRLPGSVVVVWDRRSRRRGWRIDIGAGRWCARVVRRSRSSEVRSEIGTAACLSIVQHRDKGMLSRNARQHCRVSQPYMRSCHAVERALITKPITLLGSNSEAKTTLNLIRLFRELHVFALEYGLHSLASCAPFS